jgi:hypothetical protein
MRNSRVSNLPLAAGFALALAGCAQSTRWNGGDACTQLAKNRTEIQDLEARIADLQGPAAPGDEEARLAEVRRLEERKRDLQRSSASLQGSCAPPEGMVPDQVERQRERRPGAF